jgi:uncharacterized protein (TIGR03118 family)
MQDSFRQSLKQSNFPAFAAIQSLEPRRLMAATTYTEQDLTSDGSVAAAHADSHLVNPWGMAVTAHGIEVADNVTGFITGYDANGVNVGASVSAPGPNNQTSAPTGIVENTAANAFMVNGVPANFITVTENGTVDAWSTANKNHAVHIVSDESASGALYKGVAIANFNKHPFLYAANFSAQKITVFNSSFQVTSMSGNFTDPTLPAHYSPFNVQTIGGQLYVEYAKHVKGVIAPSVGAGTGLVDVFNPDGTFVRRIAAGGKLDAPWGVALAPANFGSFSNDILIGNFGDGKITAFTTKGKLVGQLQTSSGAALSIDGLWGIEFGNGKAGTLTNGLYFAAGIEDYSGGLYGRIVLNAAAATPATPTQTPPASTPTPIGYTLPGMGTMSMSDSLDKLFM